MATLNKKCFVYIGIKRLCMVPGMQHDLLYRLHFIGLPRSRLLTSTVLTSYTLCPVLRTPSQCGLLQGPPLPRRLLSRKPSAPCWWMTLPTAYKLDHLRMTISSPETTSTTDEIWVFLGFFIFLRSHQTCPNVQVSLYWTPDGARWRPMRLVNIGPDGLVPSLTQCWIIISDV